MILLAIDPGKKSGFAAFEQGRLLCAGPFDPEKINRPPWWPTAQGGIDRLVIERPRYRPHSKVDPNDLVALAWRAGRVEGIVCSFGVVLVVEHVYPEAWKGNLSKPILWARAERSLAPGECFPTSPDARDAVGLGLWALQRLR